MSDHVEGIVAKITEKVAGRNGNKVYNICIESSGQDDEWFGHGFDEPIFQEGDEIEFDIAWNGDYANIDTGSVNIIEEGEPKAKPSRGGSSRGSSRSGGGGSSRGGSSRSSGGSSRGGSKSSSRGGSSRSSGGGSKGKGASSDTMSKDEWANKDKMIRRQACMNTSINLVKLLLSEGAISIPKKKSDAYDAVVELCNEEAERLYDQYEEQVYGGGATKKRGSGRSEEEYDDDIPE